MYTGSDQSLMTILDLKYRKLSLKDRCTVKSIINRANVSEKNPYMLKYGKQLPKPSHRDVLVHFQGQ